MSTRLPVIGVKLRRYSYGAAGPARFVYVNPAHVVEAHVGPAGEGFVTLAGRAPYDAMEVEQDAGWRELLRIMGEPEGTEDT